MNAIISVENLSKKYIIGRNGAGSDGLRHAINDFFTAPARWLRRSREQGAGSQEHLSGPRSSLRASEPFWALRDVSFEMKQGEVVGIIGRNGAGKSTLLKILSRITEPTEGRVRIRGRVASLLEVGTGFHPELTGRENVFLNGAILGMSREEIKRKFDEIVAFAEVEKFLDTPVKRYSSGMYVRLAFAVAAHLEPEILVVDEVLAVGDIEFQKKCLGKMENVSKEGRTVLFVSHNMAVIQSLCTGVVVLNNGVNVFSGRPHESIDHWLNLNDKNRDQGSYRRVGSHQTESSAHICVARVTSRGRFNASGYSIGDPLEFRVECKASKGIRNPRLGIGIENSQSQRIVTLHSQYGLHDHNASLVRGTFTFQCEVKDIALAAGSYRVKMSLENVSGTEEVLDPAFELHILDSDYYGVGGKVSHGMILCRQSWSMVAMGDTEGSYAD